MSMSSSSPLPIQRQQPLQPPTPPLPPPQPQHTPQHLQPHQSQQHFKPLPLLPKLSPDLRQNAATPKTTLPAIHLDPHPHPHPHPPRPSLSHRDAADDHFDLPHKLPSYPPPSYAQTNDLAAFRFSGHHKPELPPIQSLTTQHDQGKNAASKNHTLPSFSTLTASSAPLYSSPHPPVPAPAYSPPDPKPVNHWPSLNPLTAYYTPSHAENGEPPMRMDVDTSSNSGASAASPDRFPDGRASSVSLDDPDVRMAAEALGDLRAGQSALVCLL